MPITTHVLDTSLGRPAPGIVVRLEREHPARSDTLGCGVTDQDGRVSDLSAGIALEVGTYRLTFATGPYFAARGVEAFYPSVSVTFQVAAGEQHYHIPLLLNPFGYSTYRGS